MIRHCPYHELPATLKSELKQYVDDEFGNVPFVQEREWAQPDWVFVMYEGEAVVTFYHVVLREVTFGNRTHLVAGVNNVITPKPFRGRGYSSQILRDTESTLFGEFQCDYGLLLCADALVPFYSRLNWYMVNTSLFYEQPSGKQLYDSNVMLLTPPQSERIYPKQVDLNGLPW